MSKKKLQDMTVVKFNDEIEFIWNITDSMVKFVGIDHLYPLDEVEKNSEVIDLYGKELMDYLLTNELKVTEDVRDGIFQNMDIESTSSIMAIYKDIEKANFNDWRWAYHIDKKFPHLKVPYWVRFQGGNVPGSLTNLTNYSGDMETQLINEYGLEIPYGNGDELNDTLVSKTFFSNAVKSILKEIDCEPSMKKLLEEGNFYVDMQFIDYNPDTDMIEFTPKGKFLYFDTDNEVFESKGRQSMKPHKFFTKVFADLDCCSEHDIKCFTDGFIGVKKDYVINFYNGSRIPEYYDSIQTEDWATDSCMEGQDYDYFDIYVENAFEIGIITLLGRIVGRFLRVTCNDNVVYHDRLYYETDIVRQWYENYCDEHDILYRDSGHCTSFSQRSKGKSFYKVVTLTLNKHLESYEAYPYMDTLRYSDDGVTLTNEGGDDSNYILEYTDGDMTDNSGRVWDEIDEEWIDEEYSVTIDFGNCSGCVTHRDNAYYSDRNEGFCLD